MKFRLSVLFLLLLLAATSAVLAGGDSCPTQPNGQCGRGDADNNGYPDVGVEVTGHYTSVYAYDASGDYYWDLGDGRIQGTVGSIAELDQSTLTTCDYIINYRGAFQNDPFQDTGWIMNNIRCRGYERGNFNALYVHQTDPRYTGRRPAIWGTWEVQHDSWSHFGNIVQNARNDYYGG